MAWYWWIPIAYLGIGFVMGLIAWIGQPDDHSHTPPGWVLPFILMFLWPYVAGDFVRGLIRKKR